MPKILYIEDDLPSARMVERGLRKHDVTVVVSGEDGLAFIENNHVDLILVDINLNQGMSGYDFINIMHESSSPSPPIIALSAQTVTTSSNISFMEKPVNLQKLREKINKTLQ